MASSKKAWARARVEIACAYMVWEIEAHINWSMVTCQGSTRSELPRTGTGEYSFSLLFS